MKVSRGNFLKICGAAVLGGGVDAWPSFANVAGPGLADLSGATAPEIPSPGQFQVEDASASMFRPHLNTTFAVRAARGARVSVVLAEVAEQPFDQHVEQFWLVFHAGGGASLPDGMHAFHHQALGSFDLFIVAIGGGHRRRTIYQACLSRHPQARTLAARLDSQRLAQLEEKAWPPVS